jgi:hypothetical protein
MTGKKAIFATGNEMKKALTSSKLTHNKKLKI